MLYEMKYMTSNIIHELNPIGYWLNRAGEGLVVPINVPWGNIIGNLVVWETLDSGLLE